MSSIINFLKNVFNTILTSLGLNSKSGQILLLGLDNAGKTTLLHRLRSGSVLPFPPTDRPHIESFTIEGISFMGWDLGGHEAVRHLWDDYVPDSQAIVFMIDTADTIRLEEVRDELDNLIGILEGVPLAILLNKCDLEGAVGSQVVMDGIGFGEIEMRMGEEMVRMFRISVVKGEGYQEAFQWIGTFL